MIKRGSRMRKGIYYIAIATVMGFLTLYSSLITSAETISDVNKKIKQLEQEHGEIKNKQSEIDQDKQKVSHDMDENMDQQISVQQQINEIESKLTNTRADIVEKETEIATTEKEISDLKTQIDQLMIEIADLENRIQIRDDLLRDRLRSIQEVGGKSQYISVLLGSQNFGDFITRSTAVNAIMDQDKNIMEEHAADQLALEQKQIEVEQKKLKVEEKRAALLKQKEKLEDLKAELDEQKAEQARLKSKLEKEYEELEEYNLSLEEENRIMEEQAAALEKAKQLAESEKARLEQEEREHQERLARESQANSSSQGVKQTAGSNVVVSGGSGSFMWPAAGRFTSGFGPRWGTMHNGIDIANGRGTAVVASATGVVSTTVTGCTEGNIRCGGGYGNYIIVTHVVDGQTFATLYAHLTGVSVSVGQTVTQGQQIGTMGHTGHSTGPHLHFEIHPGGYKNPADPMRYLK